MNDIEYTGKEKDWDNFIKTGKIADYLQYKNVVDVNINSTVNTLIDTAPLEDINRKNHYACKNKGNSNQTS